MVRLKQNWPQVLLSGSFFHTAAGDWVFLESSRYEHRISIRKEDSILGLGINIQPVDEVQKKQLRKIWNPEPLAPFKSE
jgi:hypothetical protein